MGTEPHATVAVGALTDVGRLRQHNEDHAVCGDLVLGGAHAAATPELRPPCIVAVADGLGGHPGGDVASRLVAERLAAATVPTDADGAIDLVGDLQAAVYAHVADAPELRGMATTLVALLVPATGPALVVNVGDSLAFRADQGAVERLTPEDRAVFGGISQCLGGYEPKPPRIRPHVTAVEGPARLLLCSDGLTDVVTDDRIATVMDESPSLEGAAARLLDLALEAGGPDNVTIAVVDLPGFGAE